VGILKLNLGQLIEDQVTQDQVKKLMIEKCPDKNASLEFKFKSTLISANATGQETLSQMSDVLSNDSGPDSDFEFGDF
jgi:hypothetical protein